MYFRCFQLYEPRPRQKLLSNFVPVQLIIVAKIFLFAKMPANKCDGNSAKASVALHVGGKIGFVCVLYVKHLIFCLCVGQLGAVQMFMACSFHQP